MMHLPMNTLPSTVICETSTTASGNMDFRFGPRKEVIDNRTRFLEEHGIAYQEHIAMRCDHTDIIRIVDDKNNAIGVTSQEDQIASEVLITQKKHLALMLFTADCQPVSFYDPVTQTIALAHISRKTLLDLLTQKTVKFLQKKLNVEPANLCVHIGPSIHKESYAFKLPLAEQRPRLLPYTEERNGFAYIDLIGANLHELLTAGIKPNNISISEEDTASSGKYFSYYAMKKRGETHEARMATILMMR